MVIGKTEEYLRAAVVVTLSVSLLFVFAIILSMLFLPNMGEGCYNFNCSYVYFINGEYYVFANGKNTSCITSVIPETPPNGTYTCYNLAGNAYFNPNDTSTCPGGRLTCLNEERKAVNSVVLITFTILSILFLGIFVIVTTIYSAMNNRTSRYKSYNEYQRIFEL